MGNCFVYEEPYNRTLLAKYDPYLVENSPYRLECIVAYKEYFIQPNIREMVIPTNNVQPKRHEMVTSTNKPYVPPKPILSKIHYHHSPSNMSK